MRYWVDDYPDWNAEERELATPRRR